MNDDIKTLYHNLIGKKLTVENTYLFSSLIVLNELKRRTNDIQMKKYLSEELRLIRNDIKVNGTTTPILEEIDEKYKS